MPVSSRRELFRRFRAEKTDPAPFYAALAERTLESFPFPVAGARVIDLGCGPGHYTRALRAGGATVLPVDLDPEEFALPGGPPGGQVIADAGRLPVPTASVDGVFCSNMLEHTPDTDAVLAECERVLRPGGWAWISWTNWYSPWGGHEITPLHYLGPRWGLAAYRRLKGEPRKNVPGVGLFPVHIGPTLARVRNHHGLRLLDAVPRYWPSQRWIMRVPGLREVASWNCVLVLQRAENGA
jgi:SAM-dependent methyltransferase